MEASRGVSAAAFAVLEQVREQEPARLLAVGAVRRDGTKYRLGVSVLAGGGLDELVLARHVTPPATWPGASRAWAPATTAPATTDWRGGSRSGPYRRTAAATPRWCRGLHLIGGSTWPGLGENGTSGRTIAQTLLA
jgi:hypothetical protein